MNKAKTNKQEKEIYRGWLVRLGGKWEWETLKYSIIYKMVKYQDLSVKKKKLFKNRMPEILGRIRTNSANETIFDEFLPITSVLQVKYCPSPQVWLHSAFL